MTSLELLLWSVALYTAGGFISLMFKQQEKMAVYVAGITAIAGGILGLFSAVPVLMSGETLTFFAQGPFPFAHFVVRLDSLAAFMVMVISLLVTVSALYSLNYVQEYLGRGAWSMGFFLNLFIASMVALVVMDNAFWFIILFEMMSLASWFDSFRQLSLSPAMASVVFLLGFFGFGAKAGMLPLHSWLPQAHPAAPSHASALMSGVMVKIGIFGIIKVGIDLLGATQGWWGIVVLGFGAVSSVLGVMYALAEHDIKRLLAWHTVENIGIILMGVGVAMVGMANDMPVLATIGLLGAIYHLLNHAVFKGLLFLGAGAVIYRIHTRDMEKMGGLAKLMPLTATAFLIGCMAISALPPLNGFVSEWYTYQSLFSMSHDGTFIMKISGPIAIVMLAITGALAAMCFVKVYGVSFCGGPRSEAATHAREVPWTMTAAMLILAVVCVLLGVGASVIAPVLAKVAMTLTAGTDVTVAQGAMLVPDSAAQAMISPAMTFLLLLALPLIPFIIYLVFKGKQMTFRRKGDAWACGYAWERDMSVSAGGFTQPLRSMFAPLYRMRKQLDPSARLAHALDVTKAGAGKVEPFWDERIIYPLVRGINRFAKRIQCLQGGDFRLYCLYVVAALVVLLVVIAA
ncbi:hydrogenase 4 subunit B [Morganella morganii]|uniref:hydrogenase 4 subunit B n=1 Tax=Morganella morganii TaxID=582 RepID=UPI001162DD23|nr:hydrogenase 4 subunit B [Morganella morganii]QQO72108.1 hydrogenase 4 subunit B [Morganella morganii]